MGGWSAGRSAEIRQPAMSREWMPLAAPAGSSRVHSAPVRPACRRRSMRTCGTTTTGVTRRPIRTTTLAGRWQATHLRSFLAKISALACAGDEEKQMPRVKTSNPHKAANWLNPGCEPGLVPRVLVANDNFFSLILALNPNSRLFRIFPGQFVIQIRRKPRNVH